MTEKILVTAVGGDIGRSVARCLRDAGSASRIIGTDMESLSAGRLFVDRFETVPAAREEAPFLDRLAAIAREERLTMICPVSEPEIDLLDRNRARFAGTELLILDSDVLRIALDKGETAQWLSRHGLPSARTCDAGAYHGEFGWPVIVKNRTGHGSLKVHIAANADELKVFSRRLDRPIAQELIGSPAAEYTVGVFSDGQQVRQIQFRRTIGFGGLSRTAEVVDLPELTDVIDRIARAMKLKGPLNVQLRQASDGRFVPFEFNARLSSTVYIRHVLGFRDAAWWVEMKRGKISPYRPARVGTVAVRVVEELFFDSQTGEVTRPGGDDVR